jgi:hypothetical protein
MPKKLIKDYRTAREIGVLFNRDVNTIVRWTDLGLPYRDTKYRSGRLIHPMDVVAFIENGKK